MRADRASIALSPWCTAAEPVAQAFSTRVAALEAQVGRGLQDKGGGEILGGETGIEVAQNDLVDVLGRYAGIGQGFARHADDQAFHAFPISLPKGVWAQPTIAPVMDASFAELWSYYAAIVRA